MSTVLGIDLGTQAVKVVFYDFDKRVIAAAASSPLRLYQDKTGAAEQEAIWWTDALADALAKIDPRVRRNVIAVGVSGQQHGFVPLDKAGNVLAPIKLWCDTSTEAQCHEIMERYGGAEKCLADAGNLILPGYTASKILAFLQKHPDRYKRMATVFLPHDYINFILTGARCMECGDASGTGFMDIRKRSWSEGLLQAIDPNQNWESCLPDLKGDYNIVGHVMPPIANQLGIPSGVPVSTGGGDNMMAAVGTGNVTPGKVTLSLGTSGTVFAYSDQPIVDPHGNIAAFCSSTGGWLPLMCTLNCTVATELARKVVDKDIAEIEDFVQSAGLGSGGVITVPYFNGERTPNLPNAKACIFGLDSQSSRSENLLRSAMEGATYALRFGMDELKNLGITVDEIILVGGGARSAVWRQIVSDVMNTPVRVLQQQEGASFGAALHALAAVTPDSSFADITETHVSTLDEAACEPESGAVEFYNVAYQRYQEVADAVRTLYP